MTQPTEGFKSAPDASGVDLAYKTVGAFKLPVVIPADADGHIQGTLPTYFMWQTPRVFTAAATDLWDLFNAAGSGKLIRLRKLFLVRLRTAALATLPDWQLDLIRTSAVGTGGTAAVADAATAPAAGALSFSKMDPSAAAIPAQITARGVPTGGATADDFLFSVFASGIHSATARDAAFENTAYQNIMPELPLDNPYLIREGQGIKMRQITATASTGVAFGFLAAVTLV